MQTRVGRYAVIAAVVAASSYTAVHAQATRTWVSGTGSDANPCSRSAPCQTFAGAMAKTIANGEINCLDPGGFGSVTINKSITIDCTGTLGGILNAGGVNGVIINDSTSTAPNTSDVILRGLTIDGAGSTPGLNGIRFISGRSLVVQDVLIQNQNNGSGISIVPNSSVEVDLEDVTITDSGNGVHIQPTGSTGALRAEFRNLRATNNSGNGIGIDTTGNTAAFGIIVSVESSRMSGNANGVLVNAPAFTTAAVVMLDDSSVSNNSSIGLSTAGSTNARMRVGNTVITGNATGVSVGAGIINTYGNNRNDGNGADGAFTAGVLPQE